MDKEIVIFDLDGTLADITHRLHHIQKQPKDWKGFHSSVINDVPKIPITTLCDVMYSGGFTVFICSGRNEESRADTEEWLRKHAVRHYKLLMRPANDFRDDVVIKKEMLDYIRKEYSEPLFAVDDRQRVVDFWRSEGVTCLQCDQWEEQSA